jgi:hypothetical protein
VPRALARAWALATALYPEARVTNASGRGPAMQHCSLQKGREAPACMAGWAGLGQAATQKGVPLPHSSQLPVPPVGDTRR